MAQDWKGKSVLIVDDSPSIRAQLTDMFEDFGFTVAGTSPNGMDAVTQYNAKRPDFVSLDIVMPEMNGLECLHTLRDINPDLKFVLISVLLNDASVVQNFTSAFPSHHFLPKPIDKTQLERSLKLIFSTAAPVVSKIAS